MIASRKALIVVAAFVLMAIGLPWGGNVPAAFAQTISVTAADPPTGEQGTLNLSVTIKGKGFKNGAKAKWFKTGTTDPAGVNVKSTQYVSSTQLIATIDIADAASLSLFDIQVANTDGRTGKGTGLFSVTTKAIDPCTLPDPVPTASPYTSGPPGMPGYFDSTFGSGGKVIGPRFTLTAAVGSSDSVATDHANRIIVVGTRNVPCTTNTSAREVVVVRYLPDGSPDVSFGTNGLVSIAFGGEIGSAYSVAVQADGKIVIGGAGKRTKSSMKAPVIIRLNEAGSLDPTFGSGGFFWFSLLGTRYNCNVVSLALQPAGSAEKIAAVGWSDAGPRFVLRLNANGTFDGSFNGTGYSLWSNVMFQAVRMQPVAAGHRIVVVGYNSYDPSGYVGSVWRFTDSGTLDTSFGGTGMVQASFHDDDSRTLGDTFHSAAIDGEGRIVAIGAMAYSLVPGPSSPAQNQLVLARYDTDGNPDASFGVDGSGRVWVPLSPRGNDIGKGVAVQGDGRIVVSGFTYNVENQYPWTGVVWRLEANGSIDTSFGYAGSNVDAIATGVDATYLGGTALQADGRIVCAGYVSMPSNPANYIVIARFWQ
jgi:uncharacterized delta-60 repeat protein